MGGDSLNEGELGLGMGTGQIHERQVSSGLLIFDPEGLTDRFG